MRRHVYTLVKEIIERPMPATRKLFLLALANHVNAKRGDGKARPPHVQVAEIMGKSVKTVQKLARECHAAGLIDYTPGSGRTASRYRFVQGEWTSLSSQSGLQCPPNIELNIESNQVKPCVPQEKEHPMNAQEVQEALKAQVKKALAKPEESLSLTHVIRSYKTWVGHYLGVSVGSAGFTSKEGAILKNALKKYPGLAVALWYACTRWPEFSAKVASDHGLKVLPNYPTPLWVAAYLSDLAAFADECSAKPPPSQESKWKDL